jgi:hypothetical protein
LKSTGLEPESGLWETIRMTKTVSFKKGDLVVLPKEKNIVFQVVGLQVGGDKCVVQEFDVSHQKLVGNTQMHFSASDLRPFMEDASQVAARIVREATGQ